jgi:hypothetical protein|tara:strand:- start:521 stop:709 length:189 start_codon:yes stop_codon:yes gene_type:complete
MSKTSHLDEIATEVAKEILQEIYQRSNKALEYSDLDIEGDDFNDASSYIMDLVIIKLKQEIK